MGNVIPYTVKDYMSSKLIVIKEVIPGNIQRFPNESLSYNERVSTFLFTFSFITQSTSNKNFIISQCSLHTMISTNVNKLNRGDDSETCQVARSGLLKRYLRDLYNYESGCPTEDGVVLTE